MFGRKERYEIVPYRGFGNRETILVKGRVLRDKGMLAGTEKDGSWRNFVNMLRRFESDEFPGARVQVRWRNEIRNLIADEEGYFEAWLPVTSPVSDDAVWERVEVTLCEPESDPPVTSGALVLIPAKEARLAVVSDLDDTVVQTGATNYLRMVRTILLGNARTRLPFEGVAAFYRALERGTSERYLNPLFYVSSSPWNIYDLLVEFLEYQKIPAGPVLLRDWGVNRKSALPIHHKTHKLTTVRNILELYPDLPFILIGDSGQEDPEIYCDLATQNPGRVLSIYIRDVSMEKDRAQEISVLSKRVRDSGTNLILTPDTHSAAHHAESQGWILPGSMRVSV